MIILYIMSLNQEKLQVIRAVDKGFDFKENRYYTAFDGGKEVYYKTYPAVSVSNSTVNISCDPTSEKTIFDPIIWQKYEFALTYTATNNQGINRYIIDVKDTASPLKDPICDAPRAFPIGQISASLRMDPNGSAFTENIRDHLNEFLRINNAHKNKDRIFSLTPSQLDQGLKYETLFGTNRSPFARYEDNVLEVPRASYVGFEILTNPVLAPTASGQATVKLTVYEPILLSPFFHSKVYMTGIDKMTYLNTLGNLQRVVCRSPVNGNATNPPLTLTSLNVSITNASLIFRFVTPKLLSVVPKKLQYPYYNIQPNNRDVGVVNAGVTVTKSFNAINIKNFPKRIILFVKEKRSDTEGVANVGKTDVLNSKIVSANIEFNNRTGILASADESQLYKLSVRNGLEMSWTEYSSKVGSILILDFGRDIGMVSNEAPGINKKTNLTIELTFKNISDRNIDFTLNSYLIYDGVVNVYTDERRIVQNLGVLSERDVLESNKSNAVFVEPNYKDKDAEYFGGFVGKLLPIVKGIRKAVQVGAPIAKKVADWGEKIGLGYDKPKKRKKAGRIAGSLVGGKKLSKRDLLKMMGDYY